MAKPNVNANINVDAKDLPDILAGLKATVADMKGGRAVIHNATSSTKTFYCYNSGAWIKLNTQYKFPAAAGKKTEVYVSGWGGMKVFVENKEPGWGVEPGKAYIYDGDSISNVDL